MSHAVVWARASYCAVIETQPHPLSGQKYKTISNIHLTPKESGSLGLVGCHIQFPSSPFGTGTAWWRMSTVEERPSPLQLVPNLLTSREQLLAFPHLDVSSCLDSSQIFASCTDILEYLGCGESGFKIPSRVSG